MFIVVSHIDGDIPKVEGKTEILENAMRIMHKVIYGDFELNLDEIEESKYRECSYYDAEHYIA